MIRKAKHSGRPPSSRNLVAGEHLRLALKLLGKTWRRDLDNPNHVLNWENWTACGLPRSATTIDRDIRLGISDSRLSDYARCLGVAPQALASPQTDMRQILGNSVKPSSEQFPSAVLNYRDHFPERFLEHNSESYIRELFALMNGVYRMLYILQGVDVIHRCCMWIHSIEAYRLAARGRFIMFGVENSADGNIFRWHNNLHLHYISQNGMELGYTMTVDPLRHNLVCRRSPFWLKGQGLTDRGLADNTPITFTFRKEKLPMSGGMSQEDVWRRECEAMRQRPFIAPGEADYQQLWSEIMAPDVIA